MASNQPFVITNSPTTAESMPLLTEAVELEENPPPCLKAKPSNTSNALDEMIQVEILTQSHSLNVLIKIFLNHYILASMWYYILKFVM